MYLFIDPSEQDSIRLVLFSNTITREHVFEVRNRELLSVVVEALDREHVALADLQGIVVMVGEGRFSSTRIASVVANTLSYALHIPVVATTRGNEPTGTTIETFFAASDTSYYITPTYSGEPHIGIHSSS
jgi:tRNA A37 threonylcarbamoyladenosine modification protein TsaB